MNVKLYFVYSPLNSYVYIINMDFKWVYRIINYVWWMGMLYIIIMYDEWVCYIE